MENLNPTNSRAFHLSIFIDQNALVYTVFDPESNTIIQAKKMDAFIDLYDLPAQALQKIIREENALNFSYAQTSLFIHSSAFTIIPEAYYHPDRIKTLLSFNTKLPNGQLVYKADFVPFCNSWVAYCYLKEIEQFVADHFGNVKVYHAYTPLLSGLANQKEIVLLSIYNGFTTVTYIQDGQLKFHNIFSYSSNEDMLYTTLNIYQQFNLNPETDILSVCGDISENDEKYNVLYKYIRHVKLLPSPLKISIDKDITLLPHQYIWNLTHHS